MFDPGSRYAGLPVRELEAPDPLAGPGGGTRSVRYVSRRVLPPLGSGTPLAYHRVTPGERLDVLAGGYVSDPTGFWLICDANPVVWPEELEQPGRTVLVAMPGRGR